MRRNFALDQGEVDVGFVLTYQSLPVSEHVTVDYDAVMSGAPWLRSAQRNTPKEAERIRVL